MADVDIIPVASPRKSIKAVNKSEVFIPDIKVETMVVKSDTKKCIHGCFWCNTADFTKKQVVVKGDEIFFRVQSPKADVPPCSELEKNKDIVK